MSIRLLNPQKGRYLEEIHSTNDWIKDPSIESGSWVIAESQSQGRGRKGKVWRTVGEEHIVFSGKMELGLTHHSITLISLFAGSALLKSIYEWLPERMNDTFLKWPNDIYRNDKKISGILIETELIDRKLVLILGFGLNIYGKEIPEELKTIVGFLEDQPVLEGTKERILYSFLENMNDLAVAVMDPSRVLQEIQWIQDHSFLIGKNVQFMDDGSLNHGIVMGYDEQGFLIVVDRNGMKKILLDTDPNFGVE